MCVGGGGGRELVSAIDHSYVLCFFSKKFLLKKAVLVYRGIPGTFHITIIMRNNSVRTKHFIDGFICNE